MSKSVEKNVTPVASKCKFQKLDAAILMEVRACVDTTQRIWNQVWTLAAQCEGSTQADTWGIVKCRLQALRKAGRIEYSRKDGWRIAGVPT